MTLSSGRVILLLRRLATSNPRTSNHPNPMSTFLSAGVAVGILFLTPCLPTAQCSGTAQNTEDFTGGSNGPAFSFGNGFDTVELAGGNPGGYLHNPNVQNFAAILRTSDAAYQGDYRSRGVSKLSMDFLTNSIDFGNGNGFELSILLRDTKGTPDVNDDDYTYFVGPNIPLVGSGWGHFDFDIPSDSNDAVPAGWAGGWVGDLQNFRPGVTFQDVIQSVDTVEVWTLNPAFFAIFQRWDVGVDNVSLEFADPTWCDVGVGAMPGSLGAPTMQATGLLNPGTTLEWDLGNAAVNSTGLIFIGTRRLDAPFLGGTLVPGARFIRMVSTDSAGEGSFDVTLRGALPTGIELYAQYWVMDASSPSGWTATDGVQSSVAP